MVQVFRSANYYRKKVHEQIHHLELLLNELKNELPSSGPLKFADANIKLIDLISEFFIKELEVAANDKDIIDCCKKYLQYLQDITKNVIPFLECINEAFIPSELLLTLAHQTKELANKLNFTQNFDLRLCPRWDFNYGVHAYKNFIQSSLADLPTQLFPELLDNLPSFPELFIFIRYPRSESRNILLHSTMIHELGHLVNSQAGISNTVLNSIRINIDSFKSLFRKETEKEKSKPKELQVSEPELIQSLFDKCLEIAENWLKEFISDLVATHLLGPAYLFTLFELSTLTDDMHHYSESHPSSGIRLRFISEELYEMYLKNSNKLTNKKAKDLISILRKDLKKREERNEFIPTGLGSDYFNVVYVTVTSKSNRSVLQKAVRKKMKVLSYDTNDLNSEVPSLSNNIVSGVPPSELQDNKANKNKAASFASILNAGWLAYFFGMNKFYSLVSASEDSEKLKALDNFNELLLKGAESSYILQEWPKG